MATKGKEVTAVLTPTDDKKRVEVKVKQPALVGEIIEVSWKSGIDTARAKTKIAAPHWKKGEAAEEDNKPDEQKYSTGSKKPGVYLVKSKKGVDTFTVKVNISKSEGQPAEGKLTAKLGNLTFEGKCPTSKGEHEVSVTIKDLPEVLSHYEADVAWGLEVGNASFSVANKTRLELFVIFDKPMRFYTEGVWAEALRFVFKNAKVGGSAKPEDAAKKVTTYCHTGHGMRYDTRMGGPAFFSGDPKSGAGFMSLRNYIIKKPGQDIVNCYDQAAAVQSLCGALGVNVEWTYLKPFGYIKTTNLVGVGSCNNPFFNGNGSTPVVASDSPKRTAFGNHAFVDYNGKIFDACAGPHTGTETPRKYLEASIDDARTAKELGILITPPGTLGSYLDAAYLKKYVDKLMGVD